MSGPAPLLVLVTGPPASGKTTIASELARLLDIPAIHKDAIKEQLAEDLPGASLEWSQRLGGAAYGQLYLVGRQLVEAGRSCLLEANFHPQLSRAGLLPLALRSNVVQVVCGGDPDTLMARYRQRHAAGGRHPVHLDADPARLDQLAAAFRRDHRLDLDGLTIVCDTTAEQPVDPRHLVEQVTAWLSVGD